MPTITEALLDAIEQREETLYRIAKDSGVDYAALHRFAKREQGITNETMDKLAEYLELELKPKVKRKGR